LARKHEILQKRAVVHRDLTISSLHVGNSNGSFTLSTSPSLSTDVQFWLTFFLGQRSAEIEKIDSVEFYVIIRVQIMRAIGSTQSKLALVLSKLSKMSAQVVLVEGILFETVEQRYLQPFFLSKCIKRVVSLSVSKFNFLLNLNHLFAALVIHVLKLGLIIDK
jgi:hypothetical protein